MVQQATPTDALAALARVLAPVMASQQATEYGIGYKHDASGTPIATGYSHGPGGNFTYPGVDPAVFHTLIGNIGIIGRLPTTPAVDTNPTYSILTGVQDVAGTEKNDVCDDARTAGLIKQCLQTSVFGRYELSTLEIELNRLGQVNDRADPMDLGLVGNPINAGGIFASGRKDPRFPGNLLTNEVTRKFWELNVAFHRLLSQQLWTGNPVNNSAGGGYKELTGIQSLVRTGHVDAEDQTSCPSVDSDLKDFNFARLDANGDLMVEMLSYMIHTREDIAFRTGVSPVRFVLAMRPAVFWELTAIWACSYLTDRCVVQNASGERITVTGAESVAMRDSMRAGRYLLIDGQRIEVVLDDGIPELTPTTSSSVTEGCRSSDIYLLPMSVVGGRSTLYMEYFDYGNPSLSSALGNLVLARQEGSFLTWPRQTNQCVVWQSKVEPRLILRTPWLAGRIQNVMICPLQNERQPFPDDPYYTDGGRITRDGPSYYNMWNQP